MTRLAELHAGGDPGHTQRPGEGMPPGAFEIGDFLAQASLLWGQFEKNAIGAVVGICMRARLIGEKLGPHDSGVFL